MIETVPLVDNRGEAIEVGNKVAYNWSGEIACGIVESATPAQKKVGEWGHVKRALIKVKATHPTKIKDHVSLVRNPKNVMVIFE